MTSDLEEGDRPRELVGVGCDTEERSRLERTLERDPGFLERWYRPEERADLQKASDPVGLALQFFCLKEAAIKALWSCGPLGPDSVECHWSQSEGWRLRPLPVPPGVRLEGHAGLEGGLGWARVLAWRDLEGGNKKGREKPRPKSILSAEPDGPHAI